MALLSKINLNNTETGITSGTKINDAIDYANQSGGNVYDIAKTYPIGTVISNGGLLYISNKLTTAGAFLIADWDLSPERGGVIYDGAKTYAIGDVVSEGGLVYVSLTGLSTLPSTNPTDWELGSNDIGGMPWAAGVIYVASVAVISAGVMYISVNPHTSTAGDLPLKTNTDWTDAFIVSNVDPGTI